MFLNTKLDIINYSTERSSLKLGGETKHKFSRVRKLALSSLKNLIAFYKGEKDLEMLSILYKELEYREFFKQLRISVKVQ